MAAGACRGAVLSGGGRPSCADAGSTGPRPPDHHVAPGGSTAHLTALLVERDDCADTVTFRFEAPVTDPPAFQVRYHDGPFLDSADRETEIAGSAFLYVRLRPVALAHRSSPGAPPTYTGPHVVQSPPGSHVTEVAIVGAFENDLRVLIGLDARRNFVVRPIMDGLRVVITSEG
jgi:hypothetical protein